jgi:putative flippase GtrA
MTNLLKKLLAIDFVRFCIVGALGFVVNFSLLTMLYQKLGLHIVPAQLIAGEIALFSNFYLHHNWTYKSHHTMKTIQTLLIQFHATSWFALLLTTVIVAFGVKTAGLHYTIALMIAAAIALVWNFVWSKYVIWHRVVERVEQ